jgi:hypothetical protein
MTVNFHSAEPREDRRHFQGASPGVRTGQLAAAGRTGIEHRNRLGVPFGSTDR